MWSDQQQGGKAFFRFTSDLVAHEAELAGCGGGDSGGIVVERYEAPPHGEFAYRAAGVHVHSGNDDKCRDEGICRAWYSTAQDLEDLTQLVICRSSGC